MRLIDADRLAREHGFGTEGQECGTKGCGQALIHCQYDAIFTRQDICEMIDGAPTVGNLAFAEWIEEPITEVIICSNCLKEWNIIDNNTETFKYCPNCGALMTNF